MAPLAGLLLVLGIILWPGYALFRLVNTLGEVLVAPIRAFDHVARFLVAGLGLCLELEGADLRASIEKVNCDLWLIPSPFCNCPRGLPSVLLLQDLASHASPQENSEEALSAFLELVRSRAEDASLVLCVSDSIGDIDVFSYWGMQSDKVRRVDPSSSNWPSLFREAALLDRAWHPERHELSVLTADQTLRNDQTLEACLFLQISYLGGVWEATKTLLRSLVEINRERGRLRLTFAVTEEQERLHELDQLSSDLTLERMRLRTLTRAQAQCLLGANHPALQGPAAGFPRFALAHSAGTFRADAWFALVDRFPAPLLPARPYGVLIYDLIQRHVPEIFSKCFLEWAKNGMAPTARLARAVVTTNEATQAETQEEYNLAPDRLELAPVPCEPHARFGHLTSEPVPLPPKRFILNVANAAPHKGAVVLLKALSRLKRRLGEAAPFLVMCGCNTEHFSPSYQGAITDSYWKSVRNLTVDLDLQENHDVFFLGYPCDRRLLNLFQRCSVVVNAASYDNGTFTLIEAHYFGRPVLSSRYPAAEALYQRFGIPVEYFPINDDAALAHVLELALMKAPLEHAALDRVRQHLANPKFGSRRYAEQIYDLLVRLAEEGRRERLGRGPTEMPPQQIVGLPPPAFWSRGDSVPA